MLKFLRIEEKAKCGKIRRIFETDSAADENSLLPVLLLGTALGAYFMLAPFGEEAQRFLHVGFSCPARLRRAF